MYKQKIKRTSTLATLKDLINVFLKNNYQRALIAFDDMVNKTTEIIRKGKTFVRKHRPKKILYL